MEEKGCGLGAEGEEGTGRSRPVRKGGAGVRERERGRRQGERKHLEMTPLQDGARGLQELGGPQRTKTV